ncbi:MAG: glutathione synthase [Hyphomonadaceae bacterium]|jgi:glutathione synthase|nr:glutathione synthase [Hyphomonadaceae bacterium]
MTGPLRVAIQMDPIESISIGGDTTFAMALSAQARGHRLWVYGPGVLGWHQGRIMAPARPVTVRDEPGNHVNMGDEVMLDLASDVDVVLMRQDPPFDMAYLTAAHLLECLKGTTLVVNDPFWVRSSPEKIFPLMFADLMPPTLVSRDRSAIRSFFDVHKDIVVKPLFGNAGAGVFRIKPGDGNLGALLDMFFGTSREPVMVQAFIPDVFAGDKRILIVNGEPVGVLNRIPQGDDIRSNLAAGGKPAHAELSDQDRAICARLGPVLQERGLLFVGIDVIAGRLTEINVTSPTGARAIMSMTGVDATALMWDAIGTRVGTGRQNQPG